MPKAVERIDPGLIQFATVRQIEMIEATEHHGSMRRAAKALGMAENAIKESMARLRDKASRQGYSPDHNWVKPVPETHVAKGVSTYYDADGKVRGQWVKADIKAGGQVEAMKAVAAALSEELPRAVPVAAPAALNDELLNVYVLTDVHIGALCWAKETGEAWDLEIAERTLWGCFEMMISSAPPARHAYIAQLGDLLHSDSMKALTPASGHLLDQDGRFPKLVAVAVRVLRRIVDLALAKHERVTVLMADANHDPVSGMWLRAMFRALYENEPRIEVVDSEFPYYGHKHGDTMVCFHHGHLAKKEQLPLLFATAFSRIWGETRHRVVHVGHMHHTDEKEHNGMTVFQHPTMAAKDAYAARGGWLSQRAANCVTYHKTHGEVSRIKVRPEMLEA